jgi:hypothetical protein
MSKKQHILRECLSLGGRAKSLAVHDKTLVNSIYFFYLNLLTAFTIQNITGSTIPMPPLICPTFTALCHKMITLMSGMHGSMPWHSPWPTRWGHWQQEQVNEQDDAYLYVWNIWKNTMAKSRAVPQLWQLWQLPHFAGQSSQLCKAISKFHAHICRQFQIFTRTFLKFQDPWLSNFNKIVNKSQQENSRQGEKILQR